MARLIIAQGETLEKVWIYGRLVAATRNHPACQVFWNWHVAPTLLVNDDGTLETQVIDPSLFSSPIAQDRWVAAQGDPTASIHSTAADIFHRTSAGVTTTDSTWTQTNRALARYRRDLLLRSAGPDGAPPYGHCP